MNTGVKKFVKASASDNNDSFNFELWAKEVKPLLLAALKKRAEK